MGAGNGMKPRVLITGGLGFLGSHLADRYSELGWSVIALDNMTANVVSVTHPTLHHVLIADARQIVPKHVASADLVIHAASPVGAAGILPAQGTIAGEVVHSTQRVVDACIVAGTPLVNISTSEVYGITGMASETDPCTVPARYSARLEYQAGKIAAEQVVGASVARGLRAVQIRPWNMAGPREAQTKGFVVPRMVCQALAGDPITVFEGGQQERAFTGVWDVCRFITDYLPGDYDAWQGQAYNVGNEANRTTINDLAHIVKEVTGSDRPIAHTSGKRVFGPRYEEASAGTKLPDASLARKLGWEPEQTLRDIVARTAAEQLAPEEALIQ
jgi:nucleoside-diphosphate-sugar epimerase